MRKIGLLGGTFNPPHLGHLLIANEVRHALALDEVRLMPTAESPHKSIAGSTTALQRLNMVELAVQSMEGLEASSFEIDRGGVSYTYDTIQALRESEPQSQFYFIIGGDMIDYLANWHRIDELIKCVQFIGVNRPGYKAQTAYPIQMVDCPQLLLSSSELRERFARNENVQLLVPETVEAYIRQEGLYGATRDEGNR